MSDTDVRGLIERGRHVARNIVRIRGDLTESSIVTQLCDALAASALERLASPGTGEGEDKPGYVAELETTADERYYAEQLWPTLSGEEHRERCHEGFWIRLLSDVKVLDAAVVSARLAAKVRKEVHSTTVERLLTAIGFPIGAKDADGHDLDPLEWIAARPASPPQAPESGAEADETGVRDDEATHVLQLLANALHVKEWHIHDGTDDRDDDIAATIQHILNECSFTRPPEADARGLRAERDDIAREARRHAGMYEPNTDGRNTFVMLANWIDARNDAALAGQGK